jgi:two-component system phosphate regulon sensor histidine kinase PhoR
VLRSRFLWKLYAGYVFFILLTAGIVGALLALRIELRNAVTLAVGIAILVALLLGFLHARRVTRPVLSMATAAELIAAGDYEEEVRIESSDELGTLARAFNTMSRELRRSIATVEADRNTLTAILSSMVEGVVAVDRDERIVHVNDVAGRLFGVVPERALSKPIWEVTRIREISEMLSETLREEELVQRVVRRPGSPDQILDLRASPLRAGGGRLAGAVLVLDDITQLRQLETMRRDFVGNVSHELKTPVTAIRGLVETLLDDPEVEPVRRVRYLSKIRNQADRLANLVGDLLSLSRLESGGIVELVAIDVRDAVEGSIRGLRPTAEARRIVVVPELPERPIVVEVDEDALEQAVSNLLDNALKYTPEGGTVHVRLTADPAGEGRATIEVQDTGIGIEPRHRERIFERFYRVDTARSRELGGTGLGLAIVKHVAQALRGEVSVDSVSGEGSTFRIHLPLADAGATEELPADVPSPVEAPG